MKRNKKDYLSYLKKISGLSNLSNLDENKTNILFDELLSLIPNNGKLYKYKEFYPSKKFYAETYDALYNGYNYLPLVSKLNDDLDTTLNFNYSLDRKRIKREFLKQPIQSYLWNLKTLINNSKENNTDVKQNKIKYRIVDLYLKKAATNTINKIIRSEFGLNISFVEINNLIAHAREFFVNNPAHLDVLCDYYCGINRIFREHTRIHSFASSYKQNAMWAFYCKNSGICIEYDLFKLKEMDYQTKRMFLQTQKVNYASRRKYIKLHSIVAYILSSISGDFSSFSEDLIFKLMSK